MPEEEPTAQGPGPPANEKPKEKHVPAWRRGRTAPDGGKKQGTLPPADEGQKVEKAETPPKAETAPPAEPPKKEESTAIIPAAATPPASPSVVVHPPAPPAATTTPAALPAPPAPAGPLPQNPEPPPKRAGVHYMVRDDHGTQKLVKMKEGQLRDAAFEGGIIPADPRLAISHEILELEIFPPPSEGAPRYVRCTIRAWVGTKAAPLREVTESVDWHIETEFRLAVLGAMTSKPKYDKVTGKRVYGHDGAAWWPPLLNPEDVDMDDLGFPKVKQTNNVKRVLPKLLKDVLRAQKFAVRTAQGNCLRRVWGTLCGETVEDAEELQLRELEHKEAKLLSPGLFADADDDEGSEAAPAQNPEAGKREASADAAAAKEEAERQKSLPRVKNEELLGVAKTVLQGNHGEDKKKKLEGYLKLHELPPTEAGLEAVAKTGLGLLREMLVGIAIIASNHP